MITRRRVRINPKTGMPYDALDNGWTYTTEWKWNGRNVVPGTELSMKGLRGRFRFMRHVSTPDGREWIDVWGGTKHHQTNRSFAPERIRTVHRLNKTERNVLLERKAAAA